MSALDNRLSDADVGDRGSGRCDLFAAQCGALIFQAAGLDCASKIADRFGALVQYNYDGVERKWAMEPGS